MARATATKMPMSISDMGYSLLLISRDQARIADGVEFAKD
jgi:hypothetical protein